MQRFKGLRIGCTALILAAVLSSASFGALVSTGDSVTVGIQTGTTSGNWINSSGAVDDSGIVYAGEILITDLNTDTSFKTFCLQLNVDITPYFGTYDGGTDGLYIVDNISDTPSGGMAVSDATKWVWCNYYYGNFGDDGLPLGTTATDVQEAIWSLQNDVHSGSYVSSITSAAQHIVDLANQAVLDGMGGDPNIAALNLVTLQMSPTQSMLIMQPPEGVILKPTPEPMSLAIWGGLSLVGLAFAVKRRRFAS